METKNTDEKMNKQEKLQLLKNFLCEELKDGDIFFNAIIDTLSESQLDKYIDLNNQEICVHYLPTNITIKNFLNSYGAYSFSYNPNDLELTEKINNISKTTEIKAYTISGLVFLIFFISFLYVLNVWRNCCEKLNYIIKI